MLLYHDAYVNDCTDIQGGCMCGAIRYRLSSQTTSSTVCHCPDCRHAVGAQSVARVTVPTANFSFTSGTPVSFRSSDHATRTFCDRCGTSLTFVDDKRKHETDVTTGSLDDPEPYPPTEPIFTDHRITWCRVRYSRIMTFADFLIGVCQRQRSTPALAIVTQ